MTAHLARSASSPSRLPRRLSRRHQRPVSRQLRAARWRRRLVGVVCGLALGWGISTLLAMTGASWWYHASIPWWGGIGAGVALSLALTTMRSLLKRLRIKAAALSAQHNPLEALVAVPIGAATASAAAALALAALGATASPAVAQGDPCTVTAAAPGLSGPPVVTASSRSDPLIVNPSDLGVVTVVWEVPPEAEGRPLTMRLWAELLGMRQRIADLEGDATGTYRMQPTSLNAAPGLYQLRGDLSADGRTVCGPLTAWVRVGGSPLTNRYGWAAALATVGGAAGLLTVTRWWALDLWSFTTANGVTLDILDAETGRLQRGPLTRGDHYRLRTTIDFPDPASAYAAIPGPVEMVVGLLGTTAAGATTAVATVQINPAAGVDSAEVPFTAPSTGSVMTMVTDLSVAGNVVQSIRIVEGVGPRSNRFATGRLGGVRGRIHQAVGQVVYRMGSWAAGDLTSIRPTDATMMLHGVPGRTGPDGTDSGLTVEAWLYTGDVTKRVSRTTVDVHKLAQLSDRYRQQLETLIATSVDVGHLDWDERHLQLAKPLRALGRTGSQLRCLLVDPEAPPFPLGAVVAVAHDTEATGSATFTWNGLYNGPAIAYDAELCLGQGRFCTRHPQPPGADTLCLHHLWAAGYELAWPSGWVPTEYQQEQPGLGWIRRLRGPGSATRRLAPNLLVNHQPVRVHHAIGYDLNAALTPEQKQQALALPAAATAESESVGSIELASHLPRWSTEAEIIHLFGHGHTRNDDFALVLDLTTDTDSGTSTELDGDRLLALARQHRLARGPIVIINACRSGSVGLGARNGLADALRRLGARAVVVNESRVEPLEAAASARRVIASVVAGQYVSTAVRDARAAAMSDGLNLSNLAMTYYGPPGLRLTRPVMLAESDQALDLTDSGMKDRSVWTRE